MHAACSVLAGLCLVAWHPGGLAATPVYGLSSTWLDDRAQPYPLAGLRGQWTVMTMAYGACRRICSTSLRTMQAVQALADARRLQLNFVVLGLDASQDRPADWAAFRQTQKLQRPNWQFLTGDAASTRAMAQRLGVRYWRYGEHTMHDFKIVLLSPDGEVVREMAAFDMPADHLLP